MRNWLKKNWLVILALVLLLLLAWSYKDCSNKQNKIDEQTNIINAINDKGEYGKDSEGKNYGKNSVIETPNPDSFTDIKSTDPEIVRLQELVKKYEKQLKNSGSATTITSNTRYEDKNKTDIPVYQGGQVVNNVPDTGSPDRSYIYLPYDFSNKDTTWVKYTFRIDKDFTSIDLKIKNDYSLVIGEESQGWFRPKKPFALVTAENPHTEIKTIRTYKVTKDNGPLIKVKPGLYTGYGGTLIDGVFYTGFQAGGGVIITF